MATPLSHGCVGLQETVQETLLENSAWNREHAKLLLTITIIVLTRLLRGLVIMWVSV